VIPMYCMSVFLLLVTLCKELNSMMHTLILVASHVQRVQNPLDELGENGKI
jgi:hypothetical protein